MILYCALRANLISIPLDRDEGIFGYGGWVILNGGIPYRDFVDIKPPGTFFLNAIGLALFPATPAGIHSFLHLYNFLTTITLFFVGRNLLTSNLAGYWVAFVYAVFSSVPTIQGSTASTEMFMTLPLSLCLLLTERGVTRRSARFSVLGGVSGALVFWIKATGASMVFFIFVFWSGVLVRSLIGRKASQRVISKHVASWMVGFFGTTAIVIGYFFWHGVFDEFAYWSFTESFHYSQERSLVENLPFVALRLSAIFQGNWFILILGLIGITSLVKQRVTSGLFLVGFLIFSIIAIVPGFAYRHYFAQLAPAVGLIGGLGFYQCLGFIEKQAVRNAAAAFGIVITVCTPLLAHPDHYYKLGPNELCRKAYGTNPFPESLDVAEFIRAHTVETDTVFVFGSEPQILLYAGRRSATSFAITYPLMRKYPRYMEFQKTAWKELNQDLPRYIVYIYHWNSFLYDGKAELWIKTELDELLRQRYDLQAIMPITQPKSTLRFDGEMTDYWPKVEKVRKRHIFVYRLRD